MPGIILPEPIVFEWDKGNEKKNWKKHNVSIEAEDVFYYEKRLLLNDIKHSDEDEERYVLFGKTNQGKMLFIVFTIRKNKVRVISARKADKKEVKFYEEAISIT